MVITLHNLTASHTRDALGNMTFDGILRYAWDTEIKRAQSPSQRRSAAVTLGKAWQGSLPEPEKVALALGYDRGEWHIRGDRLRKRFTDAAASPSSAGPRALTARVRLGRDGVPVGVSFNEDGLPVVFQGLEPDALLSWLDPGGWESVRVTARGGASNVSAEVRYVADGLLLIMR